MVEPILLKRSEHTIARRDIDSDALRILYRLREAHHTAYLVGGSVRDLLLGRRPKDFDIGTSAHPYQIKRLFRNCWIIGRRFRLAHIRFGTKVIEVATFRRQIPENGHPDPSENEVVEGPEGTFADSDRDRLIRRDNAFGTAEEDAFRRDFTVNALFYDTATHSVIDYVGGLKDLEARVVRCIGDPNERFREDPVRMMRAVALAARLDFRIDDEIYRAIARHRAEISRSAPARLLEEYYKILRAGRAERTFRELAELGLIEPVSPELHRGASEALWASLRALDAYRQRFELIPETLTNAVLLGTILVPLGFSPHPRPIAVPAIGDRRRLPRVGLGALPIARRDIERLRQILGFQPRLVDLRRSLRSRRALMIRSGFAEALTWLEIHAPESAGYWREIADSFQQPDQAGEEASGLEARPRRRRRRRRWPEPVGT
jgi:poly(A) polymerase